MLLLTVAFLLSSFIIGAELRLAPAPRCTDEGCSHECVIKVGVPTCTCPADLTLGSDKKTCQVPVPVLLGMFRGIFLYTEGNEDFKSIVPGKSTAFDFHFNRNEIFAYVNGSILKHNMDDKLQKPQVLLQTDTLVTSLAVDWVHDDLYWICQQKSAVEAASMNGSNHQVIVQHNDTFKPARWNNIVVDPYVRKLFWLGDTFLFSSDLTGSQVQTRLPEVSGQLRPEDIALDTSNQLIYIIGSRGVGGEKVVMKSKYDGSQEIAVLNIGQHDSQVFGFGVLGNTLYWESSHDGENIYKCVVPKSGEEKPKIVLLEELYQVVYDMKLFHRDIQKALK